MSAAITHLTTTIIIGGHSVSLQSTSFPDLKASVKQGVDEANVAVSAIKNKLEEGISFSMDPEQVISINFGHIVEWVGQWNSKSPVEFTLPPLLQQITDSAENALKEVSIKLSGLSVNTKGSLRFNVQVAFDKNFYSQLGIPDLVSNLFSIDNMGLGITYEAQKE